MPMLYNSNWAYGYWPNYSWLILIGAFLILGFLKNKNMAGIFPIILSSSLLLIFISGIFNKNYSDNIVFKASQLPSDTGIIVNSSRFVEYSSDKPGFVTFGPFLPLRKGSYTAVISYKSPAEASEVIGWADIFNANSRNQLIQVPIYGTVNLKNSIRIDFESTTSGLKSYEFRTYWNGVSNLEILDIILSKN
jgi:hypothetical protein